MIFDSTCKSVADTEQDFNKNKLDFSMIYKQMNQYIYVIGGFIEHSKFTVERLDI